MIKYAIIIGYSGHAYVVIDNLLANGFDIIGYCEAVEKEQNPYSLQYLGDEASVLSTLQDNNTSVFIAIGDNKVRSSLFDKYSHSAIFPVLIHPKAFVSQTAILAEGTIIMQGAMVNSLSNIGKAVICNTGCIIEHECKVGDFSHIAPGAVLTGNVTIGKNSFVGANAVVRQGIRVGNNVLIGAGAVIVKDIPDDSIFIGNPGKIR